MGQGLQGLALAGGQPNSEGAQVRQSEGRWEQGQVWPEGRGFGQTEHAGAGQGAYKV